MGAWKLVLLLAAPAFADLRGGAASPPGSDLTVATIAKSKGREAARKARKRVRPKHGRAASCEPAPSRRLFRAAQAQPAVAFPVMSFQSRPASPGLALDPADQALLDSLDPGVAKDTVRKSLWRNLRE